MASALEQEMGAPALLIPFGQASDACHLANERIARANLLAGKNVRARKTTPLPPPRAGRA